MVGAARTQAPTATNNDAGSPTWGDLKLSTPPLCAMEVTSLGHSSSWSGVDPVQVSTFNGSTFVFFYTTGKRSVRLKTSDVGRALTDIWIVLTFLTFY